jgi:hypothetical protein
MENAVRRFQGHLRVFKHYFESKVKRQLPSDSAMFTWLIPWAAECLNKFKVGADGLTCYERITKHECKHEAFGFGESVMWQMAPDKTDRDKLDNGVRDGIFLAVIWRSGEFLIGTTDGRFKTQTVKARPVETSYDPSCIDFITTRYSSYALEGGRRKEQRLCMQNQERLVQRPEALKLEQGLNGHRGVLTLNRLTSRGTHTRKVAQVVLGCKVVWRLKEDATRHAEREWRQR